MLKLIVKRCVPVDGRETAVGDRSLFNTTTQYNQSIQPLYLPSHVPRPYQSTLSSHPFRLPTLSPIHPHTHHSPTHPTPFQVLERYYAGNTLVDGPLGIATGDIHAKKGVGPAARATLIKSIRRQNSSSGELIALDRWRDGESDRLMVE